MAKKNKIVGQSSPSKLGKRKRRKGKAGEQDLANTLKSLFGVQSRRGQQRSGLDQQDVLIDEWPDVWAECKRCERLSIYAAMDQVVRDAKDGKVPTLFHRRNKREWLMVVRLQDLERLVRAIVMMRHDPQQSAGPETLDV